jgi:hypothetical protein
MLLGMHRCRWTDNIQLNFYYGQCDVIFWLRIEAMADCFERDSELSNDKQVYCLTTLPSVKFV